MPRIRPLRPLLRRHHFWKTHLLHEVLFLESPVIGRAERPEIADQILRGMQGFDAELLRRVVKSQENPSKFLKAIVRRRPWAAYVLQFGKEFTAEDPGPSWRGHKPWLCYENAMAITKNSNGRFAYAEGLCVSPFGAMLHAWNVYRGRVLDYTWPCAHLNHYFGITFGLEWLLEHNYENGCVFGHWEPVHQYLCLKFAN